MCAIGLGSSIWILLDLVVWFLGLMVIWKERNGCSVS